MSFPRYERYKESGVDWLGEVPEHWDVVPLKRLADFINGDAFKPTEWTESGTRIIRIQNLNGGEEFNFYEGEVELRYLVHDGDLLFGWSGNRGTSFGPFLWKRKEVCALNQHIFRVEPATIPKESLYWTLKAVTAHVEDQAHGIIGMVHITKGDLGAINVPIPPSDEHRSVATFLDKETAKIDALVEEQRRLIELLKEKRQAVISHAVTKGLNIDAPLTHSGIDWLGPTPKHWQKLRIGAIFRERNDAGVDGLPILSVSIHHGVSDRQLDDEEMDRTVVRSDDQTKYKRVCSGDLVYNMMRAWQGGFGTVNVEGMVSPAYVVARPSNAYLSRFVEFILRTPCAVEEMRRYSQGVTDFRLRLYWDKFKCIQLSIPALSEQEDILSYIETKTVEFDRLTEVSEEAIAILRERRSALISAAVTGKIDFRSYSPKEAA